MKQKERRAAVNSDGSFWSNSENKNDAHNYSLDVV